MAKKKAVGNGAGTVYPRRNKEGKRRYVSAKHKNDCRTKLRKVMSDADQGIVFDAKNETVSAFLERWLRDVVEPNTAHRTYAAHRQQVRSHIIPSLGRVARSSPQAPRRPLIRRPPPFQIGGRRRPCAFQRAPRSRGSGRRARGPLRSPLRPVPAVRPPARRGAGAPVVGRRPRRRLPLRRAPVAAGAPGRGRVRHARVLRTQERQSPQGRTPQEGRRLSQEARGEAGRRDRRGGRAIRASRACVRPTSPADRSTPRTSSTAITSRFYGGQNCRPSASTTCATAASPCSPNAASPSGTSRLSPDTRRRRSRCNATPTTTARRPAAPPGRWTRPSVEPTADAPQIKGPGV